LDEQCLATDGVGEELQVFRPSEVHGSSELSVHLDDQMTLVAPPHGRSEPDQSSPICRSRSELVLGSGARTSAM
jgi:hypothetical protein